MKKDSLYNLRQRIDSLGLKDRYWEALDARVNRAMTLLEVGEEALGGVTRERARQVIKKSSKRIISRVQVLEPALDELENHIGGFWSPLEDDVTLEDAAAVARAILVDGGWKGIEVVGIVRLLTAVRTVVDFGDSEFLKRWPEATLAAATVQPVLGAHPEVALALKSRAERERKLSYVELGQAALTEANEPLHWRTMAERASAMNRREKFSISGFYNAISCNKEIFVRVGKGTYGLAAWGLEEVENYPDIIAECLQERGRPMSYGAILAGVEEVRPIMKQSLQMFLDMHPRFYLSEERTYGLRGWLRPRAEQTLRTPPAFVETRRSYARVERALQRGYDVERIVEEDRMRGRRPGGRRVA